MKQDNTGGYRAKCDTVWAAPGKCRINEIRNNVYAREIWNAAIEKAAHWLETADRNDTDDAKEVRKLKV